MEEVHQLHWPAVNESHRLTSEKKAVGPMRPVRRRKGSDSSGQVPNFQVHGLALDVEGPRQE